MSFISTKNTKLFDLISTISELVRKKVRRKMLKVLAFWQSAGSQNHNRHQQWWTNCCCCCCFYQVPCRAVESDHHRTATNGDDAVDGSLSHLFFSFSIPFAHCSGWWGRFCGHWSIPTIRWRLSMVAVGDVEYSRRPIIEIQLDMATRGGQWHPCQMLDLLPFEWCWPEGVSIGWSRIPIFDLYFFGIVIYIRRISVRIWTGLFFLQNRFLFPQFWESFCFLICWALKAFTYNPIFLK